MKKLQKMLVLTMVPVMLLLGGCNSSTGKSATSESKSSSVTKYQATIKVVDKTAGKTLGKKEVSFKKGDDLLAVLDNNFDVEESKGFITAIDGVEQNEKAQEYWTFTVNGKDATKGASQIKLVKGDKIIFTLAGLEK